MRRRRALASVLGLAVCLAVPAQANAQQATGTLSLDQALDIARVGNPTVQQASNQLALNSPERWSYLFGQLFPSVSLNLFSTGYTGNLQRRSTDNFGNPIEAPTADWVYFSNTTQRLDLTWSFQGYSIFNDMARRENTLLNRDVGLTSAQWDVRGQVQRQYFDALEQRDLLAVEQSLQSGRRVDLESSQRLFELGGSRVDVLTAEVQVQQQEIAIEQQRAAYEQALLGLSQTLGGAEVGGVEERELPVFDPTSLDAGELTETALRMNPGLRQAEVGVAGAQIGVRESKEIWWPQLTARYGLSRTAQARDAAALGDLGIEEQDIGSNFSIRISIPAFGNYFQTRSNQASAQVTLTNQELTLQSQRLQVEADVRSQLIQLKNQWRALQIAELSIQNAEQATILAREEYALGLRTFEQLQDTVEQEATTRRQALTTRYGFVDALLALQDTVGQQLSPTGTN